MKVAGFRYAAISAELEHWKQQAQEWQEVALKYKRERDEALELLMVLEETND